jgi:hypothetical protein
MFSLVEQSVFVSLSHWIRRAKKIVIENIVLVSQRDGRAEAKS